ncbi:MAG: lysophospholipid acyltransferase family protein, partial [Deferribacteres bacterium]|nr:lysophospholipid acyltransferase family protein [Deferribacteres bacterium]
MEALKNWLAVNLLPPLASLYYRSLSVTEVNRSVRDGISERYGKAIYAFWHNRFFPLIMENRGSGVVVLVSQSRDGDLIDAVLRRFGFNTVRGSSSKGAVSALKALVKEIERGRSVAIMPDGPRGPRYEVKEGVVALSRLTGVPIVPVSVVYSSYWELNSWDRFMIPRPFSKVVIGYGEPFLVKRDMDVELASLL